VIDARLAPSLSDVAKKMDKRKAWEDVMWAILNTREFLFRHRSTRPIVFPSVP
jgi:hypothetical protein